MKFTYLCLIWILLFVGCSKEGSGQLSDKDDSKHLSNESSLLDWNKIGARIYNYYELRSAIPETIVIGGLNFHLSHEIGMVRQKNCYFICSEDNQWSAFVNFETNNKSITNIWILEGNHNVIIGDWMRIELVK